MILFKLLKWVAKKKLVAFCQGIQKYSPVDSYAAPEPWDMPGYEDQVIMAAGTFCTRSFY